MRYSKYLDFSVFAYQRKVLETIILLPKKLFYYLLPPSNMYLVQVAEAAIKSFFQISVSEI